MEYLDLVTKITKVEQAARKISDEAQHKLDEIDEVLDKEREELHNSYFERAKHRIDVVRETENAAALEQIARLETQLKTQLEELNHNFEERRAAWTDKIFSIVIGAHE